MTATTLEPIHDTYAEEVVASVAILGAGLDELGRMLQPGDFYTPALGRVFDACLTRYEAGEHVDPVLIGRDVNDPPLVDRLLDVRAAVGAVASYAELVASTAAARRLQHAAAMITTRLGAGDAPADVRDAAMTEIDLAEMPVDGRPVPGLWSAQDLLSVDFPEPEAIIPGFLRRFDRLLVVGAEGSGKSWWLTQLAVATALGVNAVTFDRCEPRRTLVVDCENSEADIRLRLQAFGALGGSKAPVHVFARPGGLDIRTRRDRDMLHRACEQVQPELVCIGPLYKLFRTSKGETDEQASTACQNVLDDLRSRFGFALALEHHAPKGSSKAREMVPFGSSAWMRWPEFGWGFIPVNRNTGRPTPTGTSLEVAGFRRDRWRIDRPTRFDRGGAGSQWPWVAHWDNGRAVPNDPGF